MILRFEFTFFLTFCFTYSHQQFVSLYSGVNLIFFTPIHFVI
uniref:Uncharacterized protein n=1 Tax=Manihot esculenta TaxID=3983 RepID=A0A2C9WDK8_MANES